jgi:hypothetical protein
MINPAIAIFSDFAVWLVTLLPAVVAFWKGRGPWKVWSLAMALLTLPVLLLFSGLGDPLLSKSSQRWVVPLCIWLAAWLFAKVAIKERIRDERDTSATE